MESEAVLLLGARQRYTYWLKEVADQELIWSLCQGDGWALGADDHGRELVPVWPHEWFAGLCAQDAWAGHVAKPIGLDMWMERWIPGMVRDNRLVAVFPTPADRAIAVEPAKILEDLRTELSNYDC